MEVDELDIPRIIKDILKKHGYASLYPPQAEAINLGLLDGVNLIASIPTASGKTLIAELAIVNKLLNYGGKALYFTPLRALASEKYMEFSKYNEAKIKVALSTGDYDSSDEWLEDYDIIVTTYEKADSLTRHRPKWISNISVIVADEVHLINDGDRGPILEILLAKLMKINPKAQIVALSATIRNAEELKNWIKNSKLLISDWRPVELKEGVYYNRFVYFSDGEILSIPVLQLIAQLILQLIPLEMVGKL